MRLPQGPGPGGWRGGDRPPSPPGTLELMSRLTQQPVRLEGSDWQWLGTLGPAKEGLGVRKTCFKTLICSR